MAAHKYAEMIKAKADNMDLVVFIQQDKTQWEEVIINAACIPSFAPDFNYFLCLPKNKEACLHWLNGGDVEIYLQGLDRWEPLRCYTHKQEWLGKDEVFMQEASVLRIKPRKETRWIAHFKSGDEFCTTDHSYESIEQLKCAASAPYGFDHWQFIEIEIEV